MITRVATFSMNDRMLAASLQTQARMAQAQLQQASGAISTDYGGLGGAAGTLVDLQVSLARSKAYAGVADEAGSRVQVMYDALTQMTDLLSTFRSSLSAAISGTSDSETLAATSQNSLEELANLLNTRFEGRYLFAGSDTTTQPVDVTDYAANDTATSDTGYYRGNAAVASVAVSSERTISYGLTADQGPFEQALRSFSIAANAGTTSDTETLQAVYDLASSALDGIAALQGRLSVQASALSDASAAQSDVQDLATELISKVNGADVTQLAVQLSSYETQLQASYAAMAKIQSLNLLDYLK